ncbi:MAG: class I SAM-dependent methyltransferase [Acidimicrobiales bacterium]
MYGVGFTPWEADAPMVRAELDRLLAREEAARQRPYGSALDLGCGSGQWSIELARRGWQVVGVDVVAKAIRRARRRARDEGVDVTFVEGDVTALHDAGIGSGFSFVLDIECFNHLGDEQRASVGREVNAVTTSDATMLMLVWRRARRGLLAPGAGPEDLIAAFAGWEIVGEQAYEGELPRPLRSIAPRWYRLARM